MSWVDMCKVSFRKEKEGKQIHLMWTSHCEESIFFLNWWSDQMKKNPTWLDVCIASTYSPSVSETTYSRTCSFTRLGQETGFPIPPLVKHSCQAGCHTFRVCLERNFLSKILLDHYLRHPDVRQENWLWIGSIKHWICMQWIAVPNSAHCQLKSNKMLLWGMKPTRASSAGQGSRRVSLAKYN